MPEYTGGYRLPMKAGGSIVAQSKGLLGAGHSVSHFLSYRADGLRFHDGDAPSLTRGALVKLRLNKC